MTKMPQGPVDAERAVAPVPPELEGKTLTAPGTAAQVVPDDAVAKAPAEQNGAEAITGFTEHVHSYLWENVALADQKATFLFGGLAAALVFLHEKQITQRCLIDPRSWQLDSWIAAIAVAGCLLGAALALVVVLPRLAGAQRGIVYWRSIARFKDSLAYARHVETLRRSELQEALLRHSFELAQVAKRKFGVFNFAIWIGSAGLVSALLYLALF